MSASERTETDAALPDLPEHARSTVWAGIMLLVAIEATVIGSLVVSYFFLRVHALAWPPAGIEPPSLGWPIAQEACLFAAVVPARVAERAIRRDDRARIRVAIVIMGVLLAGYVTAKSIEIAQTPYSWSVHAYGSIMWTISGYVLGHGIVALLGAIAVFLLASTGRLRGGRREAVPSLALYVYFLAASSVVTFVTQVVSPRLS